MDPALAAGLGFIVGAILGGMVGVVAMCVVSINRSEPPDPEVHP